MSLLAKSRKEGQIQHITPQSAGWRYIGFDVWMLKKGRALRWKAASASCVWCWLPGWRRLKRRRPTSWAGTANVAV